MQAIKNYDVVIVGSGAAGMTVALNLARFGRVAVLAKNNITECSSFRAQGGIAAVTALTDSFTAHVQDTLIAGDGLCDQAAVKLVIERAPQMIQWLIAQGVKFTTDAQGNFHLTREGGHGTRRILHADDATGREVVEKLAMQLHQQDVDRYEGYTVLDLICINSRCVGVYALNQRTQEIEIFTAKFVVLATGGASCVYRYTTNPLGATGDGIAMAARAGALIKHMEFNQFHPTCLYHGRGGAFLISEAVRGEGGKLFLPNGEPFMQHFDERLELAPRDIVTRAVHTEMQRLQISAVYLDIAYKSAEFVKRRFPNIYQHCQRLGLDISRERIPIAPAAHYTCGGIAIDLQGRSSISGLYAVGEVSCSGLHGGNRLASNSLLECLVYGWVVSEDIRQQLMQPIPLITTLPQLTPKFLTVKERKLLTAKIDALRTLMWEKVGIIRTDQQLREAQQQLANWQQELQVYLNVAQVEQEAITMRNLLKIAQLIVRDALARKINCGVHYNVDNV